MNPVPTHIAIYGSRQQDGFIESIRELIRMLVEAGIKVSVEKKLAEVFTQNGFRLSVLGVREVGKLPHDADMAVSVGGDGTFLRTARWLGGKEIPILGINTGHLGFLAENSAGNGAAIVGLITSGDYTVERRMMLEVSCRNVTAGSMPSGEKKAALPYALNEVAFMKGAASMIDVDVAVDGFHLANYRADGLLVATPTGSTAYNLSVGGPILAPTLNSIVLAPIAPHTLTLRPVVVDGNSEIEAVVSSRAQDFRLSVDGSQVSLPCGTVVKIRRAPHCVLTVRRPGENFAQTLRSKLLWGH